MKLRALKFALLAGAVILLASCESLSYYSQAARGQLSLLMNRTTIQRVLQQPDLPQTTREKLELILQAREFAAAELVGLRWDNSRRGFLPLGYRSLRADAARPAGVGR